MRIWIEKEPVGKAAAQFVVKVQLANGHEFERRMSNDALAIEYAEGIRQGMMIAMNAIGFVPIVERKF